MYKRQESKADLSSADPFHHDSRRFEVATSCVPLMAGLRCSLDLLEQHGTAEARWQRIQTLSSALWQRLSALAAVTPLLNQPPASGLVSFQISDAPAPADLVQQLGRDGIWIRDLADPSCLRACTHICTSAEEIDQLTATLGAIS